MALDPEQTKHYISILHRSDIFHDLSAPQMEMIASLCSEIELQKGEVLFEEHSTGDELYVIADGMIDIVLSAGVVERMTEEAASEPLTVATLRQGQTFGELALVDKGLRSASAHCASRKARLLVIERDRLLRLCDSYPDLGYLLMRNVAADLAFKIRDTDLMIRERLLWQPREG